MIASIEPKIPKLPDGKNIIFFILTGIVCAFIGFIVPKCDPEPINFNTIEKKNVINKQKRVADSLDKRSDITDSIRIVYVDRWRAVKTHTVIAPCPEALDRVITLTDSIISIDSTQINQLNAEIYVKELIIANQDTLLRVDSIELLAKDKKIRKLKWQRNIAVGAGTIGWILAAFK